MIHTNVFDTHLSGLKPDIEPNVITSPSGTAITSVQKNIMQLYSKPPTSDDFYKI